MRAGNHIRLSCAAGVVLGSLLAFGGTPPAGRNAVVASNKQQQPRKVFVLDVVRMAVALPQSDPQDRLRVLQSAASVVAPLDSRMARSLAREGAQLEAELINNGQKPAVSVLSSGLLDCADAVRFVESIPPAAVQRAEDALVSAITFCKQAVEPARSRVETALSSGIVAARPLLALMELSGPSSRWSQGQFVKMFSSLPAGQPREAPNFGAMFARMAPAVDKDASREAGLKFLEWLSKQPGSGERNLAVTMVTSALEKALGREGYEAALRSNVVAQGMAQAAGRPGEIEHADEQESVSVLEAMGNTGKDRAMFCEPCRPRGAPARLLPTDSPPALPETVRGPSATSTWHSPPSTRSGRSALPKKMQRRLWKR